MYYNLVCIHKFKKSVKEPNNALEIMFMSISIVTYAENASTCDDIYLRAYIKLNLLKRYLFGELLFYTLKSSILLL